VAQLTKLQYDLSWLTAGAYGSTYIKPYSRAYLSKRQCHLVLYGLDGKVKKLCYFLILKPIVLDKLEDELAAWWQLVNSLLNAIDHFGGNEKLFRLKVNAAQLNTVVVGLQYITLLLPQVVEGCVPGTDEKVELKIVDTGK
jgi:hypothetical protein